MKAYKVVAMKVQKEKEVVEGQFAVLDSENAALNKALVEAKATRDEAIVMAVSLKFEQERLIRVAGENAEDKVAKAISEKE